MCLWRFGWTELSSQIPIKPAIWLCFISRVYILGLLLAKQYCQSTCLGVNDINMADVSAWDEARVRGDIWIEILITFKCHVCSWYEAVRPGCQMGFQTEGASYTKRVWQVQQSSLENSVHVCSAETISRRVPKSSQSMFDIPELLACASLSFTFQKTKEK